MKYYEVTTCRLAIRLCIGYGPTGRKKHRTFSMKGINPDASWEAIMEIIRALAPVLEYPIVEVQKVTSRKIIFYEDEESPASSLQVRRPVHALVEAGLIPAGSEMEPWGKCGEWERIGENEKLPRAGASFGMGRAPPCYLPCYLMGFARVIDTM